MRKKGRARERETIDTDFRRRQSEKIKQVKEEHSRR